MVVKISRFREMLPDASKSILSMSKVRNSESRKRKKGFGTTAIKENQEVYQFQSVDPSKGE